MLMLHALAQPYKKNWHNIIDTLVFTNLTIINALSIFIYTKSPEKLYNEMIIAAVHTQIIFISLPLMVVVFLLVFYLVSKVKRLVTSQWMNKSQHRTWSDSLLSSGFLSKTG